MIGFNMIHIQSPRFRTILFTRKPYKIFLPFPYVIFKSYYGEYEDEDDITLSVAFSAKAPRKNTKLIFTPFSNIAYYSVCLGSISSEIPKELITAFWLTKFQGYGRVVPDLYDENQPNKFQKYYHKWSKLSLEDTKKINWMPESYNHPLTLQCQQKTLKNWLDETNQKTPIFYI